MACDFEQELSAAREAALAAGRVQMESLGRTGLSVERKPDASPVSEVDRRCEALVREHLARRFPCDGFLGEETGATRGSSGRTWIVDPLDGTRPYLRGIPTFSVLIGLEADGGVAVGCMHLPALDETYWARRGGGAFLNGRPIRVSRVSALSQALCSGLGYLQHEGKPVAAALRRLLASANYAYGFMDAYTYGCVAAGRIDVCVNLLDKAWDSAAAACVITEAGGRFSDVEGRPTVHTGSTVVTNGILHETVLAALRL
jgi:histidinol phosphatase-like enzyme (inositol monophosphatase family)